MEFPGWYFAQFVYVILLWLVTYLVCLPERILYSSWYVSCYIKLWLFVYIFITYIRHNDEQTSSVRGIQIKNKNFKKREEKCADNKLFWRRVITRGRNARAIVIIYIITTRTNVNNIRTACVTRESISRKVKHKHTHARWQLATRSCAPPP